jgi:D-2-hydroxyacid dehydrogenase (NADP+)
MADILISLGGSSGYFAFPKEELERIQKTFPDDLVRELAPEKLSEEIGQARAALLWQFPLDALRGASRMQFVMYAADGLGPKRMYPELIASSIQVTNSRGVRAQGMAEHCIGALLGLSRRLFEARDAQQKKQWLKNELIEPPLPGTLRGQTLLLLGVGEIGARVAQIASAGLGMRVWGVRAAPTKSCAHVEKMFAPDDLHKALPEVNAVVMTLPPTERTKNVIAKEELGLLPRGAFVINVGRGSSLDEGALAESITAGHIRGAALDVFTEEPLPPSSPLWEMPQVLLTPHSAGVTPNLWPAINDIFIENPHLAKEKKPLRNLVDKARGY